MKNDSIYADRADYSGIWDEPVAESAFAYCSTVDCNARLTNQQAKGGGKCYSCDTASEENS